MEVERKSSEFRRGGLHVGTDKLPYPCARSAPSMAQGREPRRARADWRALL